LLGTVSLNLGITSPLLGTIFPNFEKYFLQKTQQRYNIIFNLPNVFSFGKFFWLLQVIVWKNNLLNLNKNLASLQLCAFAFSIYIFQFIILNAKLQRHKDAKFFIIIRE